MFGKKEQDQSKSNSTPSNGFSSINSLAEGTVMEGMIITDNDLRVDGTIKGTLECKGRLIIGPTGMVDGVISCKNAIIEGVITGNLKVEELLDVKETANISGDVVTGKLKVQPDAEFNVNCRTGGQVLSGFHTNDKTEADAVAS